MDDAVGIEMIGVGGVVTGNVVRGWEVEDVVDEVGDEEVGKDGGYGEGVDCDEREDEAGGRDDGVGDDLDEYAWGWKHGAKGIGKVD